MFLVAHSELIMCGGWTAAGQLLLKMGFIFGLVVRHQLLEPTAQGQTWRSWQLTCFNFELAGDVEEPPFQSHSFSGTVSNQYMPLLPLPPFPPLLSQPFPDDFPLLQL